MNVYLAAVEIDFHALYFRRSTPLPAVFVVIVIVVVIVTSIVIVVIVTSIVIVISIVIFVMTSVAIIIPTAGLNRYCGKAGAYERQNEHG